MKHFFITSAFQLFGAYGNVEFRSQQKVHENGFLAILVHNSNRIIEVLALELVRPFDSRLCLLRLKVFVCYVKHLLGPY